MSDDGLTDEERAEESRQYVEALGKAASQIDWDAVAVRVRQVPDVGCKCGAGDYVEHLYLIISAGYPPHVFYRSAYDSNQKKRLMSAPIRMPSLMKQGARPGHDFENDPPMASSAQRWTCRVCGDAVLMYNDNVYGGATVRTCEESTEFWKNQRG